MQAKSNRPAGNPERATGGAVRPVGAWIRTLPKTELHIHAEAIMSPSSYAALHTRYRDIIAPGLPETYPELSRRGPLSDMIRRFLLLQDLLRTSGDYALLATDMRRYAEANDIRYMEVFVSPSRPLKSGLIDFAGIMDPLSEKAGPDIAFIIDLSRSFGPENAASNLDATLKYIARHGSAPIVGVGLGGRETGNPVAPYSGTFARAREAGLHAVAHAGEETGPESVRDAVLLLGAERIGHGTSAIRDPAVMDLLRERNITLEVCPTSNVYTGAFVGSYEEHPLPAFRDAGLAITVNSDDPALFGIDLDRELELVATKLGFSRTDILALLRTAIQSSFMPAARKKKELARLDSRGSAS